MKLLKSIVWFVVMSAALTMAVWYFFGEVTITTTLNDRPYRGLSVLIDGTETCKTPCRFKPLPGYHTLVVKAPEDEGVIEKSQTLYLIAGNLGRPMNVDFRTPIVIAPEFDAFTSDVDGDSDWEAYDPEADGERREEASEDAPEDSVEEADPEADEQNAEIAEPAVADTEWEEVSL